MSTRNWNASVSNEDYLERIHELIQLKGYARPVEIARELGVSQPSVTSMIQKLAAAGLLNYEKYRGLTLTDEGRQIAESIQERHLILTRFLSLLNIPDAAQASDIEGMEHHLSDETVHALAALSDYLESNPQALKAIRPE